MSMPRPCSEILATARVLTGARTAPHTPVAGDLDGDNDLDLAVSNRSGNTAIVLRNLGRLNFAVASYQPGSGPRALGFCDVTDDGLSDLVIASRDSAQVLVLANIRGAAFAGATSFPTGGLDSSFLVAADMNLDDDEDLVMAAEYGVALPAPPAART